MKEILLLVFLSVIGSGDLTEEISPGLNLVATIEGKSIYLDPYTERNRLAAFRFCSELGMRLAEITSSAEFELLDKAIVEGWNFGDGAWTGGIILRDLKPYVWESSDISLDPSYIPFNQFFDSKGWISVVFIKNGRIGRNGSFLTNSGEYSYWPGTLCETLPNDEKLF